MMQIGDNMLTQEMEIITMLVLQNVVSFNYQYYLASVCWSRHKDNIQLGIIHLIMMKHLWIHQM